MKLGRPQKKFPRGVCDSGGPSGSGRGWCRETLPRAARSLAEPRRGSVRPHPPALAHLWPWGLLSGGRRGPLRPGGRFHPKRPCRAPGPAVCPRGSSGGRRPWPALLRAGEAGMFSPRGAASCPPCWKPIPVTDSGRLRSGGGEGCGRPHGTPGPTARDPRRPRPGPPHCGRPAPAAPPPAPRRVV